MKIGKNRVIERSNMTSRFDNHDYDGDSIIAAALHSEQARYDFQYAFVRNLVEFEHLDELLIDYEHEAIYSAYMLTYTANQNRIDDRETRVPVSLYDRKFTMEDISERPGDLRMYPEFRGVRLTNVEAAINKVLCKPFGKDTELIYTIEKDGILNKKNLNKLTTKFWEKLKAYNKAKGEEVLNFWDIIHELDKFFLECSGAVQYCSPTFNLGDFVVQNEEITKFKENLIQVEPYIAFHQNLVLFEKIKAEVEKNPDNILNLVFNSGARLKSVQLLKAASNTGIPTDIYGKAFDVNIKNSLLDGLTPREYFMTGDSARLALAQRQEAIPKGGELQRKFFFTIGILKLDKEVDDCGTDKYYRIMVKNKSHLKLLNHRWFKDADGVEKLVDINDDSLIGQYIDLRSPVTCKAHDYKICKKCFGDKLPDSANLGALTGSGLSEGIIQSVLRTHHFGGAFIATENYELIDLLKKCEFKGSDTIISDDETLGKIAEIMYRDYYLEEQLGIEWGVTDGKSSIKLIMHELPFNDDSVKVLKSIVGLIDKNRTGSGLIDPAELYDGLEVVIEQNGILSTYLELIISLLYYDEDGVLLRYSDKEPVDQVALKNIIEMLDPKLSIFYNFSNRVISKIYTKTGANEKVDHMYHDLLDIYR